MAGIKHENTAEHAGFSAAGVSDIPLKRAFDLLFALSGLVFLAPLLIAITGLLIFAGVAQPIFRQKRIGRHGAIFTILKFRTLPEANPRQHVTKTHPWARPRTRKFTRFLRRSGLDELPQLFNVLRGEMSIVGPRPHSIADHRQFTSRVTHYDQRHRLKPGMTGWAQVNGWRGPVCNDAHLIARLSHDLEYLAKSGLAFDALIILKTATLPFRSQRQCSKLKVSCLSCQRPLI